MHLYLLFAGNEPIPLQAIAQHYENPILTI